MEQNKVVVYETKQVNELAIENLSAEPVFIQQGDLVKVETKTGWLPLAAFCVEQGRWSRRGNESATVFSGSTGLSTALGAVAFDPRSMWSQLSVWNKVTALQEALASSLRKQRGAGLAAVRAPASPTSLVLTQTSPTVEEAAGAYMKACRRACGESPCGWLRPCGQRRIEERGHLRFAGPVFGDVAEAAKVQRTRSAAATRERNEGSTAGVPGGGIPTRGRRQ